MFRWLAVLRVVVLVNAVVLVVLPVRQRPEARLAAAATALMVGVDRLRHLGVPRASGAGSGRCSWPTWRSPCR